MCPFVCPVRKTSQMEHFSNMKSLQNVLLRISRAKDIVADDEERKKFYSEVLNWQKFYQLELRNFQDHGDVGEIWFGSNTIARIVNWMLSNDIERSDSTLDIGCGNGVILLNLSKVGFTDLTGVDYVEEAISLAKSIADDKKVNINYQRADFLQDRDTLPLTSVLSRKYRILIDKGTFDAIGLCPENGLKKRTKYIAQVLQLLENNGILILTSCNWTKSELLSMFKGFQLHDEIFSQMYSFGGSTGSTATTLVLKKLN